MTQQTQPRKTNKERGIEKAVSSQTYWGDILSDTAIQACSPAARGSWLWTWCTIMHEDTDRISGTVASFARVWGMSQEEAESVIREFVMFRPCDVILKGRILKPDEADTHINGDLLQLVNRRRARVLKKRRSAAERKRQSRSRHTSSQIKPHTSRDCHALDAERYRLTNAIVTGDAADKSRDRHDDVPPLSSMSMSPPTGGDARKRAKPPMFLSELKTKRDAKAAIAANLWHTCCFDRTDGRKNHPDEWQDYRKLKAQLKELDEQIANYGDE